ncbi:MAG TPA: class A beta-lactamase-related serine hydrolase [Thermomicrobiales bacterium]|nr:class A beta-lactamase-related serine hydrolase [Thermomicrobiales bacterium]
MPIHHPQLTRRQIVTLATLGTGALFRNAPVGAEVDTDPTAGISAMLTASDAIFGTVLIDTADRLVFQRNANSPFVAASLYKLVLMTEILRMVEQEGLDLQEPITIAEDLYLEASAGDSYFTTDDIGTVVPLETMIYAAGAYSSNVAALSLLELTTIERLNTFSLELGLTGTHYWAHEDEIDVFYPGEAGQPGTEDIVRARAFVRSFAIESYVNLTTPEDMAWFFRLMRDDLLVSTLTSWRLRKILASRVLSDRLPALLPNEAVVIHKTGNLTGVLHDAGIIETAQGSTIVVAMAQAVTYLDEAFAVEQKLGLVGYELIRPSANVPMASPVA